MVDCCVSVKHCGYVVMVNCPVCQSVGIWLIDLSQLYGYMFTADCPLSVTVVILLWLIALSLTVCDYVIMADCLISVNQWLYDYSRLVYHWQ